MYWRLTRQKKRRKHIEKFVLETYKTEKKKKTYRKVCIGDLKDRKKKKNIQKSLYWRLTRQKKRRKHTEKIEKMSTSEVKEEDVELKIMSGKTILRRREKI